MNQSTNPESIVREIKRRTRKKYSSEEKIRKEQIVSIALEHPEQSPRQLACFITDKEGYFISESSV